MTDDEMREFAEMAPDSLTVQLWNLRQAIKGLLLEMSWTCIELLRLDRLLGLEREKQ